MKTEKRTVFQKDFFFSLDTLLFLSSTETIFYILKGYFNKPQSYETASIHFVMDNGAVVLIGEPRSSSR